MNLLHINKSFQYLTDCLLNLIMNLLFLIQNVQLLISCMDDLQYIATLDMFCFIFISIIVKINHFLKYFLTILLRILSQFLYSYGNVVILSKVCNLLSSLLLSALLLISSVYILRASLSNLCCDFNYFIA